MLEDWKNGGFGLYVHWPFCQSKCPYCDFNSHVSNVVNQAEWASALCSEIKRIGLKTGPRVLKSIFFGGGTPSLMLPKTVGQVLSTAQSTWMFANDIEITLEANPTSVEADRFAGFKDVGVNRISMGIQALNDHDLKRLGRLHSVAEARSAFDIAQNLFERVSFDLIYARQDQSLSDWKQELTAALDMSSEHLSLYQLTIENSTTFGKLFSAGKLRGLPNEDLAADMYELTQEMCNSAGMPVYEVSNHAKNGCESKHNLIYWQAGDYAAVGPGAHGRLTIDGKRYAVEAISDPSRWLSSVLQSGSGDISHNALSQSDQAGEYLMMGLRVLDGIDLCRYRALSGCELDQEKVLKLQKLGMVECIENRIVATKSGRPILNAIIRELLVE